MSHHESLVGDAKEALRRVFSDTSVAPAKTLDSLEDLKEYIESDIDAIEIMLEDEDDLEANR